MGTTKALILSDHFEFWNISNAKLEENSVQWSIPSLGYNKNILLEIMNKRISSANPYDSSEGVFLKRAKRREKFKLRSLSKLEFRQIWNTSLSNLILSNVNFKQIHFICS
jgi:hypothetical protein